MGTEKVGERERGEKEREREKTRERKREKKNSNGNEASMMICVLGRKVTGAEVK